MGAELRIKEGELCRIRVVRFAEVFIIRNIPYVNCERCRKRGKDVRTNISHIIHCADAVRSFPSKQEPPLTS